MASAALALLHGCVAVWQRGSAAEPLRGCTSVLQRRCRLQLPMPGAYFFSEAFIPPPLSAVVALSGQGAKFEPGAH